MIDFNVYVCLFTKLEDCDHVILILLVILHTTMYNANSLVLTCLIESLFYFLLLRYILVLCGILKGPSPCIAFCPSLPPLLSKSHIGILCLILIGGEVDIGSFGGEGVISHVFIYLIESVAFTVLFFCFSLSIINQCNNY